MTEYALVTETLPLGHPAHAAVTNLVELAIQRDEDFAEAQDTIAAKEEELTAAKAENDKLRAEARTHSLTGLMNKNGLRVYANQDPALPEDPEHQGALPRGWFGIFVDLDNFKPINDTYGHDQGDRVIKYAGLALRRTIRAGIDELIHESGDEFMLFLPEWDSRDPVEVAEEQHARFLVNVRRQIVGMNPELIPAGYEVTNVDRMSLLRLDATFGPHWWEGPHVDRLALMTTAEKAMRELKKGNRSR